MMVEAAVEKLDSIGNILHTVQHLEVTELHTAVIPPPQCNGPSKS